MGGLSCSLLDNDRLVVQAEPGPPAPQIAKLKRRMVNSATYDVALRRMPLGGLLQQQFNRDVESCATYDRERAALILCV